jgi:hypothetical protein
VNTHNSVFISNMSPGHDYSGAAKFGAIRPVTTGNFPIFKTTRLTAEIVDALVYSEADDYLLISGSSIIAAMCVSVWMELHKQANLLLYDRSRNEYVVRAIVRDELRMEINRALDRERTAGRLVRGST